MAFLFKIHFANCRMSTNAKADFKEEHMLQTEVFHHWHCSHYSPPHGHIVIFLIILPMVILWSFSSYSPWSYCNLSHHSPHDQIVIFLKGDDLHGQRAAWAASWGEFPHARVASYWDGAPLGLIAFHRWLSTYRKAPSTTVLCQVWPTKVFLSKYIYKWGFKFQKVKIRRISYLGSLFIDHLKPLEMTIGVQ